MDQDRFEHITDGHDALFDNEFDTTKDETAIGNFIFKAIKNYPIINTYKGRGGNSKFYVYRITGKSYYLHVLVHDDGSIITAYPRRYTN